MSKVVEAELPSDALSASYAEKGAFVDCYFIDIPNEISLDTFIAAFYTTTIFKVERTFLSLVTLTFASDSQAFELSQGISEKYSIWTVEERMSDQIMLRDYSKKTRSWLRVQKLEPNDGGATRLLFGSVVIPREVSHSGEATFGFLFHAFARFHQVYSRALLKSAYNQLLRM